RPLEPRHRGATAGYQLPFFRPSFGKSTAARTLKRSTSVLSCSSIPGKPPMLDCPKQRKTKNLGSGSCAGAGVVAATTTDATSRADASFGLMSSAFGIGVVGTRHTRPHLVPRRGHPPVRGRSGVQVIGPRGARNAARHPRRRDATCPA